MEVRKDLSSVQYTRFYSSFRLFQGKLMRIPIRFPCNASLCIVIFLSQFLLLFSIYATGHTEKLNVPPVLEEWVDWVLFEQEDKLCTIRSDNPDRQYCSWPSKIKIQINDDGAAFTQLYQIESKSLVSLPGDGKFWPRNVSVNGKPALVIENNGHGALWLLPGTHRLAGEIFWKQIPEYLMVPPGSGIVELHLGGKQVKNLPLDESGRLWLRAKKKETRKAQDSVNIKVFRKIEDNIPLLEHLHLLLSVSGNAREIILGEHFGPDRLALSMQSPLPIRMDDDGKLVVQVRPGKWVIKLTVRHTETNVKDLVLKKASGNWPQDEIWVFQSAPELRQIEIDGVQAIDPARTALPDNWKSFPAYYMTAGSKMMLVEKLRGGYQAIPDRLLLKRSLWLDTLGTGFTLHDVISGTMTKAWRLNVSQDLKLGKVAVNGENRLITRLPGSNKVGVEVRQGTISLKADSRIEEPVKGLGIKFSALGWDHTFQQLSAELHLPPGWKLLHASGVDKVSTWLNSWTLLDIFLVLIISLATFKLLGLSWSLLALITLTLIFHQHGSPKMLWLPLLGFLAIDKMLEGKKLPLVLQYGTYGTLLLIILASVPFMVEEIRVGLYPQLEMGSHYRIVSPTSASARQPRVDNLDTNAETGAGAGAGAGAVRGNLKKSYGTSYLSSVDQALQEPGRKKLAIDPQAMIQTGPGLPQWHWKQLRLSWNGPVQPDQSVKLVLLSPLITTVIAFLRVLLLLVLIIGFLKCALRRQKQANPTSRNPVSTSVAALFLFLPCFLIIHIPQIHAETPTQNLLDELQVRLLKQPDCKGNCASINNLDIKISDENLSFFLTIHALSKTAVPLPGTNRFFDTILSDNQPATALQLDKSHTLLRLEKGIHTVELYKSLKNINKFSISFPLVPHGLKKELKGWLVTGIHEDGRVDSQLIFTRIQDKESGKAQLSTIVPAGETTLALPPFARIERRVRLGLKWEIDTRVVRASKGAAITMEIPLVQGEMVITEGLQVNKDNKNIQINMGPDQQQIRYHSSLDPVKSLILKAADTSLWTEQWFLEISPIYHAVISGLPEINQPHPGTIRIPEYRPRPGESLEIQITRPAGITGATKTIDSSTLLVKPGKRLSSSRLRFSLQSGQGTQHTILLPEGAELVKSLIDGREVSLRLDDRSLTFPVHPGKQQIDLTWRNKTDVSSRLISPGVDLGSQSVNHSLTVQMPYSRWILFAGGPDIGPAVLFWGELLAIILIALLLGQISITPLSTLQWLLLGLGLSQIPVSFGALVVGWLLLLGLKKKYAEEIKQPAGFNFIQVLQVIMTFFALGCLLFVIQHGLLGNPDMQIGGNGSSGHTLNWYQDRNDVVLPTAWIFSLPILSYRIFMLTWSMWLAFSLLRWLRWGWDCFSTGGYWKKGVFPKNIKSSKSIFKRGPKKEEAAKKGVKFDPVDGG